MTIENKRVYELAKEYVFQIKDLDLKEAFSDLTEEFWIQGCKDFFKCEKIRVVEHMKRL